MPSFPRRVRLTTPGPSVADEASGNERPGPSTTVHTRAWLSQRPVENLSAGIEMGADQDTVISLYTLLVPGDVKLTARTTVTDENGARYEIEGDPAIRRHPRTNKVIYRAAACRRLSDLTMVG